MQNTNDFTFWEEACFYKEKFEALNEITLNYEKKKMAKDLYHEQVKALLAKDYSEVSRVQTTKTVVK